MEAEAARKVTRNSVSVLDGSDRDCITICIFFIEGEAEAGRRFVLLSSAISLVFEAGDRVDGAGSGGKELVKPLYTVILFLGLVARWCCVLLS